MDSILTTTAALYTMFILFSLVMVYHILIFTRIIPFDGAWGGRLKTVSDMRKFESISILINSFMMCLVAARLGWLKLDLPTVAFTISFWAMAALFLLNTVGNLVSLNKFEKYTFTPLTLLLSLLSIRVALG